MCINLRPFEPIKLNGVHDIEILIQHAHGIIFFASLDELVVNPELLKKWRDVTPQRDSRAYYIEEFEQLDFLRIESKQHLATVLPSGLISLALSKTRNGI